MEKDFEFLRLEIEKLKDARITLQIELDHLKTTKSEMRTEAASLRAIADSLRSELSALKGALSNESTLRNGQSKTYMVAGALLLAFLGYINFGALPKEVDKQMRSDALETVRERARTAANAADASAEQARLSASEVESIKVALGFDNNTARSLQAIATKLRFDGNNDLILPNGIKLPYKAAIGLQEIRTWKNAEYRMIESGWEEGKGNFVRITVPGNERINKTNTLTIYSSGKGVELNGKRIAP